MFKYKWELWKKSPHPKGCDVIDEPKGGFCVEKGKMSLIKECPPYLVDHKADSLQIAIVGDVVEIFLLENPDDVKFNIHVYENNRLDDARKANGLEELDTKQLVHSGFLMYSAF